jgi:hypothetical protein
MKTKTWRGLALLSMLTASVFADDQIRYNYIPDTISPEAQKVMAEIYSAELLHCQNPHPSPRSAQEPSA